MPPEGLPPVVWTLTIEMVQAWFEILVVYFVWPLIFAAGLWVAGWVVTKIVSLADVGLVVGGISFSRSEIDAMKKSALSRAMQGRLNWQADTDGSWKDV